MVYRHSPAVDGLYRRSAQWRKVAKAAEYLAFDEWWNPKLSDHMPAVIGREARKGRLRAYTADGHDGKVWLSDDFVYASEKVGEEARGRGAARRHGPVLVSATAPGGGDHEYQYVSTRRIPGPAALVRRHAAPHACVFN